MKLPRSLSPPLLRTILHYAPGQRRKIETNLEREFPDAWEHRSSSDEDFYDRLYGFLQDPGQRARFNAIARKHSNKKRCLALPEAIHTHYQTELLENIPAQATPVELLQIFSDDDDIDRLTNVAWAFLEEDQVDAETVQNLTEEYPELKNRLGDALYDRERKFSVARWKQAVTNLRAESNKLDPAILDMILAERVLVEARLMVEIAGVAREHFRRQLVAVFDRHKDCISTNPELARIRDAVTDEDRRGVIPNDWSPVLTAIQQTLSTYEMNEASFRKASDALSIAAFDEQQGLIEKINVSNERRREALHAVQTTVKGLIPLNPEGNSDSPPKSTEDDADVDTDLPDLPSVTIDAPESSGGRSTGAVDMKRQDDRESDEEAIRSLIAAPEETSADEATDDRLNRPGLHGDPGVSPETAGDDEDPDTSLPPNIPCEPAEPSEKGVPIPHRAKQDEDPEGQGSRQLDDSQTLPEPSVANTQVGSPDTARDEAPEAETRSLSQDGGDDLPRLTSRLLSDLLVKGHFARAYWVARVSSGLFDANILGALSEGARVKPGSTCPGLLAHFIDGLTAENKWSDDERLLVVAAIIQPLLFLRTYPDALYQVTSTVGVTPLTELIENFRKTYLPQGITLGPWAVTPDIEKPEIEKQLQHIEDEAREFLVRIPSIRFSFQPAEGALRFLYRPESGWRRLHELIAQKQHNRVNEVKALCEELNPREVSTVHRQFPNLKKKLVGHARDKLAKHLHDTVGLATDWAALVDKLAEREPERNERQADDLKRTITANLQKVSSALKDSGNGSPATKAARRRVTDLMAILNGKIRTTDGVDEACIDLPGIRLTDEMRPAEDNPAEDNSDGLIEAMQRFTIGESDPRNVFTECLNHDEFVRASHLIERHGLDEDATKLLERRRDDRRAEVRKHLKGLPSKVEEAFLLGQLWDSGEDVKTRAELLSLVDDGLKKLDEDESTLGHNIRQASELFGGIEDRMAEIAKTRISYLESEKTNVFKRFSKTEQGQGDRNYFEATFEKCLELEDHVTAFDLLDRARRAVGRGEPIARTTSMAPSEHLGQFLKFIEGYQGAGSDVKQYADLIHKGETALGIPFSQIDLARREESVSVLENWEALSEAGDVEEVCRFIGFPVATGQTRLEAAPKDGLFHVRVKLNCAGPDSPLPGFGSMLESRLDVVVSKRPQEPEQITEFLKQIEVRDRRAAFILMTRPLSREYRLRWLKECAQSQSMVLLLDTCLLKYLCGERNRLQILFHIGLPFTWAQPYITKGETVAREMFVGRSEEVKDLVDRNGSCIVFGGRQLGKSALLTHVRREFHNIHDGGGMFIAYLDVNDLGEPQTPAEMSDAFWKRVSEQLDRVGAIDMTKPVINKRKPPQWTDIVPNAVETTLSADKEKRIVLLLDETDKLLDLDSELDFRLVRGLRILMANTERRFKVVLAGLQSVQRYSNWKNHPFAQLGKEIVIDPLPPLAAEELIVRPFRSLGFGFENPGLVCRILSMANYHPGLIQIFCYRLLGRLYKNWQQWQSPIRKVTEDDIMIIERDTSFQEDVRNRFDWTLDLDDRYKVITYGLVLSHKPTDARTAMEFQDLGREWWSKVFGGMDAQAMRALLDEMVGLGVLVTEHNEGLARQYRLRSPNLLRLLGPRETIEDELLRIIELDRMSRPNPRDFRTLIEKPSRFGPLTKEQEGYVSDTSDLFSLTLVLGSPAMGLRRVAAHVREVMISAAEADDIKWEEISIPATGGVSTAKLIVDGLKQQLGPRQRSHRYAIINFEELVFDGELGEFLENLVQEMRKVCRSGSRGKVVVVLEPCWVWKWVCSKLRASIQGHPGVYVMTLHRWSEGAVSNALDQIGLRTKSKASGSQIHRSTAGIHRLISETLDRSSRVKKHFEESGSDIIDQVKNELTASDNDKKKQLSELGIINGNKPLENAIIALFLWSEMKGGERFLTEGSFDDAKDSLPEESPERKLLEQRRSEIQAWLRELNLMSPADRDGTEFKLCSWTWELIDLQQRLADAAPM